jgi:hypothetical protein
VRDLPVQQEDHTGKSGCSLVTFAAKNSGPVALLRSTRQASCASAALAQLGRNGAGLRGLQAGRAPVCCLKCWAYRSCGSVPTLSCRCPKWQREQDLTR